MEEKQVLNYTNGPSQFFPRSDANLGFFRTQLEMSSFTYKESLACRLREEQDLTSDSRLDLPGFEWYKFGMQKELKANYDNYLIIRDDELPKLIAEFDNHLFKCRSENAQDPNFKQNLLEGLEFAKNFEIRLETGLRELNEDRFFCESKQGQTYLAAIRENLESIRLNLNRIDSFVEKLEKEEKLEKRRKFNF